MAPPVQGCQVQISIKSQNSAKKKPEKANLATLTPWQKSDCLQQDLSQANLKFLCDCNESQKNNEFLGFKTSAVCFIFSAFNALFVTSQSSIGFCAFVRRDSLQCSSLFAPQCSLCQSSPLRISSLDSASTVLPNDARKRESYRATKEKSDSALKRRRAR